MNRVKQWYNIRGRSLPEYNYIPLLYTLLLPTHRHNLSRKEALGKAKALFLVSYISYFGYCRSA